MSYVNSARLQTQSTGNSGGRHHVILGPAVRDEDQNMGHIRPHPQRLLEEFLQNVADAFSYKYQKQKMKFKWN